MEDGESHQIDHSKKRDAEHEDAVRSGGGTRFDVLEVAMNRSSFGEDAKEARNGRRC